MAKFVISTHTHAIIDKIFGRERGDIYKEAPLPKNNQITPIDKMKKGRRRESRTYIRMYISRLPRQRDSKEAAITLT